MNGYVVACSLWAAMVEKVIEIMVKEIRLTAPSFLVSDVAAPGDEIVALQEIHELWIGQSGSKLLVSTCKTLE